MKVRTPDLGAQRGAFTPTIRWRHYAANLVAPLRQQSGGALTPTTKWLLYAENSHLGEQVAQDMIAVRIGPDFKQCVVGAPAYFKRYGKPKTPHELTAHRCIALRLPTYGGTWSWPFKKGVHELKVRPGGELAFNTVTLQLDSALAGLGLGNLPEDIVAEHVAAGRLIRVLDDWTAPTSGYHLYYPSRRQPTAAFSVLVSALAHRGKKSGGGRPAELA